MNKTTISKQTRLNNKSKSNIRKDKTYRGILYTLTAIISLIVVLSVSLVFINGAITINKAELPLGELLFGSRYNPLIEGTLAAGFIVVNTIWMAFLAILIAVPISIGTAIIITRVLPKALSTIMYSIVAILAAIPSVIYGIFGYAVINDWLVGIGFETGSLFAVVLMVAFMIVPTITIMTIASIKLTDKKLEESSYALGATKTQTSFFVTIKTAKAGIITGVIFAVGRCLGETTAISMIAPVATFKEGITLAPWNSSLFLGPAILGYMPGGESTLNIYLFPVISAFLLATSMIIFSILKYMEFTTNDSHRSAKQSKNINEYKTLKRKFDEEGAGSLTISEQEKIFTYENNAEKRRKYSQFTIEDYSLLELEKTSTESTIRFESYKKKKTLQHNIFIYVAALVGIILLFAVFIFLFNGGFEYLNWEMLTARKYYGPMSNSMYGLAVPLMGTLVSIMIALAIAVPIGAALGLFISLYVKKDTKFGFFISLILQILTAIPTIVWSTIAAVVFVKTSLHENSKGLEPAIMMGIILLPTIIKTTEDGANRLNRGLIEGAESLGATKVKTTFSVLLKETAPSIFAAALLGASTVLAESTIFVSLLDSGTTTRPDLDTWITDGGYSLSATIWKLNSKANALVGNDPEKYQMIINEIKTIGLLLMGIIFVMSISSVLLTSRKIVGGMSLLLALIFFISGTYTYNEKELLGIIFEVLALISIFVSVIWSIRKKGEV